MTREQLLTAVLEFLGDRDLLALGDVRIALEAEIDDAGPAALCWTISRLPLPPRARARPASLRARSE